MCSTSPMHVQVCLLGVCHCFFLKLAPLAAWVFVPAGFGSRCLRKSPGIDAHVTRYKPVQLFMCFVFCEGSLFVGPRLGFSEKRRGEPVNPFGGSPPKKKRHLAKRKSTQCLVCPLGGAPGVFSDGKKRETEGKPHIIFFWRPNHTCFFGSSFFLFWGSFFWGRVPLLKQTAEKRLVLFKPLKSGGPSYSSVRVRFLGLCPPSNATKTNSLERPGPKPRAMRAGA